MLEDDPMDRPIFTVILHQHHDGHCILVAMAVSKTT